LSTEDTRTDLVGTAGFDDDGATEADDDAAADELPLALEDVVLAGGADAGVPLLAELQAVINNPTLKRSATAAARWRGRVVGLGFVTTPR
jgi:hypothetical protein